MNNIFLGFLLTFLAGFSTLFGTFLIFIKKKNDKIISAALSFAAGVMLTVSFSDLLPNSYNLISSTLPKSLFVTIFFVIGVVFSMLVDKFFPDNKIITEKNSKGLYKLGIFSMIAIILHNVPEGIATFIATNNNTSLGITLSIAIALHNIPEGISISIPIYYATKDKKKAILYTFIAALSEPFGALLAFIFLKNIVTDSIIGILFAIIAGIMSHLSLYELLPASKKYQQYKIASISFIFGVLFMLFNHFVF